MNNVFKIFNQLQSTSKKNEKITILKENEDNSLFTDTLRWLLNPFVITGIRPKNFINQLSMIQLQFRLGEI